MHITTSLGRFDMVEVPFKCSIIGRTLLSLTTPHPTWVQGAIGDIGVVPERGSHVLNEGYHPEMFNALRRSSFVTVKLVPFTISPSRVSGSAPDDMSPNSERRLIRIFESNPAVLGVANEVPEVSW
jgi:hypothetical protein